MKTGWKTDWATLIAAEKARHAAEAVPVAAAVRRTGIAQAREAGRRVGARVWRDVGTDLDPCAYSVAAIVDDVARKAWDFMHERHVAPDWISKGSVTAAMPRAIQDRQHRLEQALAAGAAAAILPRAKAARKACLEAALRRLR